MIHVELFLHLAHLLFISSYNKKGIPSTLHLFLENNAPIYMQQGYNSDISHTLNPSFNWWACYVLEWKAFCTHHKITRLSLLQGTHSWNPSPGFVATSWLLSCGLVAKFMLMTLWSSSCQEVGIFTQIIIINCKKNRWSIS